MALVRTGERSERRVGSPWGSHVHELAPLHEARAPWSLHQAGSAPTGLGPDGPERRRRERSDHGGTSPSHHPGFFPGDGAEGPAQVDLVIQGHGDDGRCQGIRRARGVETGAEADLQDGDVDPPVAKVLQGGGGEDLEEGGVGGNHTPTDQALGGGAYRTHRPLEVVVADGATVDRNALVHPHEVG